MLTYVHTHMCVRANGDIYNAYIHTHVGTPYAHHTKATSVFDVSIISLHTHTHTISAFLPLRACISCWIIIFKLTLHNLMLMETETGCAYKLLLKQCSPVKSDETMNK